MKSLASILIHLLGTSIISVCYVQDQEPKVIHSLQRTVSVWHDVCQKLFYISSWSFLLLGGILTLGDGVDTTRGTCTTGAILSMIFYFISKLLGHILYIGKIRDSRGIDKVSIIKSNIHRIYFFPLLLLFIFFIVLLATSKSNLAQDMECTNITSPVLTLLFFGHNLLLEISLVIMFLWPLINGVSVNRTLHLATLMQILSAVFALVATTTNVGIIGTLSPSQRGHIFMLSSSFEIVLNVVGVAVLNHYTRKLLPKDAPNRVSRSLQPTFHDSLPNYYQIQGATFYSTSSLPHQTGVAQPLTIAPKASFVSPTGLVGVPPPALSSNKPRGSYFNFMSSLVSLYYTREPDFNPQKPREEPRPAPALTE